MANERPVPQSGNPPYPFRTGWAIFLLAGNLLIAAMYFHVINP
ncbi:MAG: photosystem I protein PsaX [Oscillatoria sp. PMC 1068.18]|nr:photosystem I protein PsaX [Oscillatoria sp. PMC 1076.18]MEC4990375.1 photosystem I protein PsaX [Oscillatoria sp. PMC 1068.18]